MSFDNSFYTTNEFKSKLKKYEEAIRNDDPIYLDADDLSDIAEYYQDNNDREAALKTADYAIKLFPGAVSPLALRCRIAMLDKGNLKEAEHFADMIEDKTDCEYYYLKAEMMLCQGNADDADTYLESKIDTIDEEEIDDYILDVVSLFIDYYEKDIAEKWLQRSELTDDPDYLDMKANIAIANKQYKEGEKIYKKLIDKDPFSIYYWNNLTSIQLLLDKISDAITSSEYAIALNPDNPDSLNNKAQGLFLLGNYEEAQKYYDRYLKINTNDEIGELSFGVTLVNLEKYDEALKHLLKADSLSVENESWDNRIEILKEIVLVYLQLFKDDEAIKYAKKLEHVPGRKLYHVKAFEGFVYLKTRHLDEANKCFNVAIIRSNSNPKVLFDIAKSFVECGFTDRAYKMLKDIVESPKHNSKDAAAYFSLCCGDADDRKGFFETVKVVCEHNPEEAREVLSRFFPKDMNPKDYYEYLLKMTENDK